MIDLKTIQLIKTSPLQKMKLAPLRVRGNIKTGQAVINIPMHCNIKIGDLVIIHKVIEGDIDE